LNPATQPPAVHTTIDLTAFCVTRPETAEEADRIGYRQGYQGMESPSPYDDSIPVETFRARCVGWVRGHEDRTDGKPSQFPDATRGVVEEEYRPTVEPLRISAIMDIEWAGFCVGANGERGIGPASYSVEERAAWTRGHAEGFRAYEDSEADRWHTMQEQQAEAFGPIEDRLHPAELVRAVEHRQDMR
jgi:hypothetical protein